MDHPSSSPLTQKLTEQSIAGLVGPFEVGVMVAIFIFGLATVQVVTYFKKFPNDAKSTKVLVRTWSLCSYIH